MIAKTDLEKKIFASYARNLGSPAKNVGATKQ